MPINFNGSAAFTTPDGVEWDVTDFTLEAWIKTANAAGTRFYILGQQNVTGAPPYWIIAMNSNSLEVGSSEDSVLSTGTIDINDDKWHHVAAVRKASSYVRTFIDGVREQNLTVGITGNTFNVPGAMALGSRTDGAVPFPGSIDEARIWNVARTDEQIKEQAMRRIFAGAPGLVCYARTDNNRIKGNTVPDLTGRGHTFSRITGTEGDYAEHANPGFRNISSRRRR